RFPVAGISLLRGFGDQQPGQMPNGEWGRTTPAGVNVRSYEATSQRRRGGTRPGLKKDLPVAPNAGWITQGVNNLTATGTPVQISQSGRVNYLVAVNQGRVFVAPAGATAWTEATKTTGDTPPLNFTGVVYSSPLNQLLYFADGNNWTFLDPKVP